MASSFASTKVSNDAQLLFDGVGASDTQFGKAAYVGFVQSQDVPQYHLRMFTEVRCIAADIQLCAAEAVRLPFHDLAILAPN